MTIYYLSKLTSGFPPAHTAQSSLWGQLGSALQGLGQNRDIYLNDLGENVPSGYTPYAVADKIKQGAVWIDWCGWPFYQSYSSSAVGQLFSGLGFTSSVDFNMADVGDTSPSTQFERSLIMLSPMGAPGVVNYVAPYGTAQQMHYGIYASGSRYWYSSFAIKSGQGAYIYAFGNNSSFGLLGIGGYTTGVPYGQFAPFAQQIISSLPAPSSVGTSRPSCPQWGSYLEPGAEAGTWTFGETSNGVLITRVVNQQCQIVPNGGPFYHQISNPGGGGLLSTGGASTGGSSGTPSSSGGGSSSVTTYQSEKATVNGTPVSALVVNGSTYLNYNQTVALGVTWNTNRQCQTINGQLYCNYDGALPAFKVTGVPGNWQFTYSASVSGLSSNSSKMLIVGGIALGGILAWQYMSRQRA